MNKKLTAVILTLALALPLLAPAAGSASTTAVPPPNIYHPVSCQSWSLSGTKSQRKKRLAACIKGRTMSRNAKRCLLFAGITTGGVVVGGVIGGVAARGIAAGVVTGGATSCVQAII